jgi:pantetheine-phosphate adenylyltransferase
VVRHACRIVDRLIVAIGRHSAKTPVFSTEERAEMLREVCEPLAAAENAALEVVTFDDLAVHAARRLGATLIIRGIRDGTDLDYEMQMAAMNEAMTPEIQTIFLPASPPVRPITATLVRQIAALGRRRGDLRAAACRRAPGGQIRPALMRKSRDPWITGEPT